MWKAKAFDIFFLDIMCLFYLETSNKILKENFGDYL